MRLEQNIPNPATNSTRIGSTLPQNYTNARIIITDISVRMAKQVNLSGTGKGTLNVDLDSIAAGIYNYSFNYSLEIDGHLIATRKILLNH